MARKHYRVNKYKSTRGEWLWRGFVYYPDDECPNPKHRYSKRGCTGHCDGLTAFTTEDDAREATAKRDAEITLGINLTPKPKKGMTLNEVADNFFSRPRPSSVREDTLEGYRRAWNARIRGTIGKKQILDITRLDVSDWLDLLATSKNGEKALAEGTIKGYRSALSRCGFGHAIRKLGIEIDNLARDQEIPASENIPLPGARVFTFEEVFALADAVPERYAFMVKLGFILGMRFRELTGLTEDAIHERDGKFYIHVHREVVEGKIVEGTKNEFSVRKVPIPSLLVPGLKRHLEKFPPSKNPHNALFVTARGNIISYQNFRARDWTKGLKDAGVEYAVTRSMRHTAIGVARDNLDFIHVEALVGHRIQNPLPILPGCSRG